METTDVQGDSFDVFISRHIREVRRELTARWIDTLSEQLQVERRNTLPSDDLLNHIPAILERLADFVSDPEAQAFDFLVLEDLARLAELRRSQGFGLEELLREYHILSDLLQSSVAAATEEYAGPSGLPEVVRTIGRMMDAMHLVNAVTARSFREWRNRYDRERLDLVQTYGQVVSHELGNRLGAAETAIQLLQSEMFLDEDHRKRLHQLILRSIQDGMQTVEDLHVLAQPFAGSSPARGISLWLIAKESVRLARAQAADRGISISLVGEVPDVRVPGPPVRIALANLLSNAIKYHRPEGKDRWVRVSADHDEEAGAVEIGAEDNGPGIPAPFAGRVFDYRFRGDVAQEGSGLGLAITRDVIERIGGSVSLRDRPGGGARFVVRVPTLQDEDGT